MSRWLHCILAAILCVLALSCLSALVEGPPAEASGNEQEALSAIFLPPVFSSPGENTEIKQPAPRHAMLCRRIDLPTVTMTADRNGSPVIALPYFRTVYQAFPPEGKPG